FETVPTWNGDTNTIVRWLNEINDIARYSTDIRTQLGSVIPRRLQGNAKTWYYSLPRKHRDYLEKDWKLLRKAIAEYYMNRKWAEVMRKKANRARYRETGHTRETPSEYYIRKVELLNTAYDLDDSEIISEVMEGAPANWSTILTTQSYDTGMDFQSAIKYHEDTLLELDKM
ncbi:hypothetical protein K435DRAFT_588146, partial [Dendrothele bispora CBS 962.96]